MCANQQLPVHDAAAVVVVLEVRVGKAVGADAHLVMVQRCALTVYYLSGIALFLVCGELCHSRLESAKLGLLSGGGGNRRNAAFDGGYAVVGFLRGVEVM